MPQRVQQHACYIVACYGHVPHPSCTLVKLRGVVVGSNGHALGPANASTATSDVSSEVSSPCAAVKQTIAMMNQAASNAVDAFILQLSLWDCERFS